MIRTVWIVHQGGNARGGAAPPVPDPIHEFQSPPHRVPESRRGPGGQSNKQKIEHLSVYFESISGEL